MKRPDWHLLMPSAPRILQHQQIVLLHFQLQVLLECHLALPALQDAVTLHVLLHLKLVLRFYCISIYTTL